MSCLKPKEASWRQRCFQQNNWIWKKRTAGGKIPAVPLDGSVSDSKVLDLLDMSYDLVDGQAEADGETGADGQATDSTTEEKDWQFYPHIP